MRCEEGAESLLPSGVPLLPPRFGEAPGRPRGVTFSPQITSPVKVRSCSRYASWKGGGWLRPPRRGEEEPPTRGPPRGRLPKAPGRPCKSAPPSSSRRLRSSSGVAAAGPRPPGAPVAVSSSAPFSPARPGCSQGAGGRAARSREGVGGQQETLLRFSRRGGAAGGLRYSGRGVGKSLPGAELGLSLSDSERMGSATPARPGGVGSRRALGAFSAPPPPFISGLPLPPGPFKVIAAGPPFPDRPLGGAARQVTGFRALRLSREAEPERRGGSFPVGGLNSGGVAVFRLPAPMQPRCCSAVEEALQRWDSSASRAEDSGIIGGAQMGVSFLKRPM